MPPDDLIVDPEAQTGVEDRQVDDTTENQRGESGDNAKTQTSAENYWDPSDELWSMYLTEAMKEDGQMTQNWTEDTGGVLVFTGLFSAIVAAFITESYKKLSPDSGDQMVKLLTQLVDISAGAPVVVQNSPPFRAPVSIVRVNVMWFLSLILSLSCALLATLIQEWARRYLTYAHWQHRRAPRRQARIRAHMFEGVENFRLSQAVEAIPLLLHTSVFLFFAGLIDFLLPINDVVAFSALGCVVVFALIYAMLTLLPSLHFNCPYRTPLSGITYISLQLSALNLFSIAIAIEGIFHELLLEIRRWSRPPDARGSQDDWPIRWRAMLEDKVSTHYKRLLRGQQWRVELSAMEAPSSVDANALHWTLTTLDEDKKFEDFAARMPGFFDPRAGAGSDATSIILSLMSEQSISDSILGSRLRELLDTCLPGSSPLAEEQRKNRLRVCLKSLWCCVKAYNEKPEVPLASYVRAIFASPEVIRWIQTEKDLSTRLLGRCFGALVVKKLASDITSPTRTSYAAITAEMACLSHILGATGEQVNDWLGQDGAIELANVISLASGELKALLASGTKGVPTDVVDIFAQTLSILAEGIDSSLANAEVEWDAGHVAQFHKIYSTFVNAQVPDLIEMGAKLRFWPQIGGSRYLPQSGVGASFTDFATLLKERLRTISDKLPPSSYVEKVEIEIPSAELDSETTPSSGSPRNRAGPRC
ncbi:hypothetical protein EDB86DRAFT_2198725 [Lactarius hatsudake]|nr:hypothetical protein EDB86DRAFT_2198725 [Lactarius hatsudake]